MALFMGYNTKVDCEPDAEPEGKIAESQEPEEECLTPLRKLCFQSLWDDSLGLWDCSSNSCRDHKYHKPDRCKLLLTDLLDIVEDYPVYYAYDGGEYTSEEYMCVYSMVGECPYPKGICKATHMPSDVEKQDLKELIRYGEMSIDTYEWRAVMQSM
jgi:hypothetical protein